MMKKSYETRIGELTFTHDFANGYPTDEPVAKLYDEMDFQQALYYQLQTHWRKYNE